MGYNLPLIKDIYSNNFNHIRIQSELTEKKSYNQRIQAGRFS